ncbi:MAG: YafY family transcriptional regulator [Gammaproteobacteria bacterium]|nr:YafY family transcriptional regulator [Gammaproteobacteria bacterium]
MHKSERLFQLVNLLRGRRTAITAEQLSEVLEVSVRSIYRDIQSLVLSGIPVEGEAGVGYRLKPGYQLPPLMFDYDEVQALLLGASMVQAWTDPELAAGAQRAVQKIRAVLPEPLLAQADRQAYRVPALGPQAHLGDVHRTIRRACEQQQILLLQYEDAKGQASERRIWPLGMFFWGERWTLVAWCEARNDYRNFRFDRVKSVSLVDENYPLDAERNLQHYIEMMKALYG